MHSEGACPDGIEVETTYIYKLDHQEYGTRFLTKALCSDNGFRKSVLNVDMATKLRPFVIKHKMGNKLVCLNSVHRVLLHNR